MATVIFLTLSVVCLAGSAVLLRYAAREWGAAATAYGKAGECYVRAAAILRAAEGGDTQTLEVLLAMEEENPTP